MRAVTRSNAEQAPKSLMWKPTPSLTGKAVIAGEVSETCTQQFHRGIGDGTYTGRTTQHGRPRGAAERDSQPDAARDRPGAPGSRMGPYVPRKPGNAGGGKEPSFKSTRDAARDRRLGDLATPESVQKLQTALHAKAKAEPEVRFYLLYDKVYRQDVLSFAYPRCKANGGAPVSMVRRSRTSRRMGEERCASGNWRNGGRLRKDVSSRSG